MLAETNDGSINPTEQRRQLPDLDPKFFPDLPDAVRNHIASLELDGSTFLTRVEGFFLATPDVSLYFTKQQSGREEVLTAAEMLKNANIPFTAMPFGNGEIQTYWGREKYRGIRDSETEYRGICREIKGLETLIQDYKAYKELIPDSQLTYIKSKRSKEDQEKIDMWLEKLTKLQIEEGLNTIDRAFGNQSAPHEYDEHRLHS